MAQRGHPGEPSQAAELVVAQRRLESGRCLDGFVGALRIGDPGAKILEPLGRLHLDLPAVDLSAAGERRGEGIDRGHRFEDPLARLPGQLGIDQHPLVAQPDHRARRLGQLVHLGLGQGIIAKSNLPAEVERRVPTEEAGQVGRRPIRRRDRGSRALSGV